MPDTGAPWNIPYVAASDLVKDWPTDNQQQAEAIAAALSSVPVQQVVQAVKTDATTITSATFVDVSGMSVSITPATNTNKVLVLADIALGVDDADRGHLKIVRDSTDVYVGDAAGSRIRAAAQISSRTTGGTNISGTNTQMWRFTLVYLDSPATTSATTYKLQIATPNGPVSVNATGADTDNTNFARFASSITVLEVAA